MSQLKSLTSGLKFNAKNNAQAKALLLPSATELALQDDAPVLLEVDALRKKHKIKLTGSDIPDPIQSFSDVLTAENELVLDNLLSSAFLHPTPVQMQAIPLLLQHRDLLICSRTGSGKTLAFALPLLLRWMASKPSSLTSIVIEPTRELARQVYDQFKLLSKDTGCRVGILGEEGLEEEAHILITTPLRLVYAIKAKSIDVKKVETLVLDEADRLFEDDFLIQTDAILSACTCPTLKKAMFSATIPSGVEELARKVMSDTDTVRCLIGCKEAASSLIAQELKFCANEEGKLATLKQFFHDGTMRAPCLAFVQSVERARDLCNQLRLMGLDEAIRIDAVHSELSREKRDEAMDAFRDGQTMVLVTTDALARGIDFKGVNLVINYDFPQTTTSYIHRIGRTARFNRPGTAVTLFTKDDAPYLRTIVNVMRSSGLQVPEWMLKLQAPTKKDKQKLKNKPVERMQVRHAGGYHVEEKKGKRKGAKEEGKAAGGGKPKAKKRKVDLSES